MTVESRPERDSLRAGRWQRWSGGVLLALGLLIGALWTWSGWYRAIGDAGPWCGRVEDGRIVVQWCAAGTTVPRWTPGGPAWSISSGPYGAWHMEWRGVDSAFRFTKGVERTIDLWAAGYTQITGIRTVHIALWPFSLVLLVCGWLALRSGLIARRRAREGACASCGYSLTGLALAAACPECGRPRQTPAQPAS